MVSEFSFSIRRASDAHVVSMHGELDVATAQGLADALAETGGTLVVLDMSNVTFLDCGGLSALVDAHNRILDQGPGRLVVSRPTGIVQRVFGITELETWIVPWSTDWDQLPSTKGASLAEFGTFCSD